MNVLDTKLLCEIGECLADKLKVDVNKLKSTKLILEVDDEYFKKLDEDIFYKLNENDKEFMPSENEIFLTFQNIDIIIKKSVD